MNIKEMLAMMGLSTAEALIGALTIDLLENIKEHNSNEPKLIVECVQAGDSFFKLLARAADLTKTQLDDKAVDVFHNPVKAFAAQEGIKL